mgnify:FL=1|tara:strand:- start:153 stop:593 length:441 start_codon:yes stop_codon:yes gene_type:complete
MVSEEQAFYVYWPIAGGDDVRAQLLDIDFHDTKCSVDCEISFANWTALVIDSKFGLTKQDVDRLPLLPIPGAPVVASMETRTAVKGDAETLDNLTDRLADEIAIGDYQFFAEELWRVTRYRQLVHSEGDDEWLASGFSVDDPQNRS